MSGVALQTVIGWLDTELAIDGIRDYGPNGLQVEGNECVRRVVTGVTANLDLIEQAAASSADLIVVHHGIFWDGAPMRLTGALGRRVRALTTSGMSLAGYHLPLDGHPTLGNSACLARALGASLVEPEFEHRGMHVGAMATFDTPLSIDGLSARVAEHISPTAHVFGHGPAAIRRLGIVTGGAARDVQRAIDLGCDAYLTGEAGEYSQATAREEDIHFIAAGHHRTERFGPTALAEALATRFPELDVRFVDVDNPV